MSQKLNRSEYLKKLAFTSLFTALVIASTCLIKIPAAEDGYANAGDAMIFVCAMYLGGIPAMIAGGIGSMLSDVILGYAYWAPWSLLIKGIEGLIAGLLCALIRNKCKNYAACKILQTLALILAALWMVAGYFFVRWLVISGGIAPAVFEVPFNLAQGGICVAIAAILVFAKDIGGRYFVKRNLDNK